VAHRPGGILHGLSTEHRPAQLGGRANSVVRDTGRRRRRQLWSVGQGAAVRRGALFGERWTRWWPDEPLLSDVRRHCGRGRTYGHARRLGMVQEAQAGPVDQRAVVIAAEESFDTEERQ